MKATLRAFSARLIVGHLDPNEANELLDVVDGRGKPLTFNLAEPEGLAAPVLAGRLEQQAEPIRWGKLLLETVAHEALASPRGDVCDAIVDGLRVAHRRLGAEGLELIPRGSSGVGFCSASIVDQTAQIVVVPPAQLFVVHQGVALSVPEGSDAGRGIWMRDDLRAEMFAGIGGIHEPDVRIYEANIGPGDTIVLCSSNLARLLTEEDVRLAVTYEEAAIGAERLKQLAIQRGADGGVAMVIEISASLPSDEPVPVPDYAVPAASPRRKLEVPPIGSIFSTARDRLLETLDRVQPTGSAGDSQLRQPSARRQHSPDPDPAWPTRPRSYRPAGARPAPVRADQPSRAIDVRPTTVHGSRGWHPGAFKHADEGPRKNPQSVVASAIATSMSTAGTRVRSAMSNLGAPVRAALPRRNASPPDGRSSNSSFGKLSAFAGPNRASIQAGASDIRAALLSTLKGANGRLAAIDLGGRRRLVVPLLGLLVAILVAVIGVRAVKAQQAHQLQQRFDSLVSASSQLESQARSSGDRNESQSLIRRAQALLDQAATLEPNQPQVTGLRKDLQGDLDRLDSILALPAPSVVANLAAAAKDVNATSLAGGAAGFFVLDGGGHRVFQMPVGQTAPATIATKGDKAGSNQLADPQAISAVDGNVLILDSNRNLWRYSPDKKALAQVGLQSSDSWKSTTAMAGYGPNAYILDATLGNIYRYASRDGQFTEPPTRFFEKDDPAVIGKGISLAIDGAIWVLTSDGQILKLEGGGRQPFTLSGLPQPIAKASQIYTDPDEQSLYVLDVGSNRVVQIAKDGRYLRQFNLNLPAPATSFYPDEKGHALYVLSANNLYRYELPAG